MSSIDSEQLPPFSFFDSNCAFGEYAIPTGRVFADLDQLTTRMRRCGIGSALIYSTLARDCDIRAGNRKIIETAECADNLYPCWVVVPDIDGDSAPPQELVAEMLDSGVRAARMFPKQHGYPMSLWLVEELLAAFEKHSIPLFVDFGIQHWSDQVTDWDAIERIATTFPKLPMILVRQSVGHVRVLLPLMMKHSNLHIEHSYFQPNMGLQVVSSLVGSERLIFGTGMPEYDPGLPMSMVAYSQLEWNEREAIAGGNLKRLLAGSIVC